MDKLTEEIKVRIDPLKKCALQQIADEEQLTISDIARRALREFIQVHQGTRNNRPRTANA